MSLELLRNRWTYPVLVALRSGPLRSAQLLDLINEGNARNADLVGTRVLHEKTLVTTLHRMEAEGLILRKIEALASGVAPWELTLMSRGLLNAMGGIATWARDHVDHLTTSVQKHRGLPQEDANPATSGLRPLVAEQHYWRGVGMALVILRLRWSYSVLCQMSRGPQHPTGIAAAINAGIARNRDITGNRALSEKVLWDTLHRLVDGGLINHQPRAGQFASTARCTLTASGYALLAALAPVGTWASEQEEHLTVIVRRRRGLDDLSGALG
ncbi:winged helix-turn-helix transcriptional regulator [Streptomyces phaeochromogenes]|uniref:winged helix-turn-helix transcriptional regulator n=1 Tax=Streptomyces phaeochromogenes TaxID=1923 RepID=UPI002E160AF8|nr:hypothetical protein OG437_36750 [Streptomyces phaeochromogenes]